MSETPAPFESDAEALAGVPEDDTLRFKRGHVYAALIPLAFAAGLATGFIFWGRSLPPAGSAQVESLNPTPRRFNVSADDDPALGPANAPVTIIEFSDFNCPYCRKWQQETLQPLLAAYPGKIRFVYRDFPITSQESAVAAQAADCANEQGAYWKFHDALFTGTHGLGMDAYKAYAQELGLDAQALIACVESGRYASEVEADARDAASLGASGTPTFFINGIPLVGAEPLAQFRQVIDAELQR